MEEISAGQGISRGEVKQQPGSAEVVKMVAADKNAIEHPVNLDTSRTEARTVPLATTPGASATTPRRPRPIRGSTRSRAISASYLNKAPGKALDPAILEFAKFILSRDGQTETIKSGFYPITEPLRSKALEVLGSS